jgi:hypothetical protein
VINGDRELRLPSWNFFLFLAFFAAFRLVEAIVIVVGCLGAGQRLRRAERALMRATAAAARLPMADILSSPRLDAGRIRQRRCRERECNE